MNTSRLKDFRDPPHWPKLKGECQHHQKCKAQNKWIGKRVLKKFSHRNTCFRCFSLGKFGRKQHETVDENRYIDDGNLPGPVRSEEHTSELQSRGHLVCRLLLEKKKIKHTLH